MFKAEREKTITNKALIRLLLLTVLSFISVVSYCQGDPTDSLPGDPGSLSVYTIRNMSFGSLSNGNTAGTLSISPSGSRTSTGSVIPLNLGNPYSSALFEIEAPQGSKITMYPGPSITLTGSNGGSMTLTIGPANPAFAYQFTTVALPPQRTQVSVGGTLAVGASPTPGIYTGSFYITFYEE